LKPHHCGGVKVQAHVNSQKRKEKKIKWTLHAWEKEKKNLGNAD